MNYLKKTIILTAAMLLVSISSFAQFTPSPLTITAPPLVGYEFDGSMLEIPIIIDGAQSKTIFCVFTKDMGASIGYVKNGHLGWHTVNNIDTCVYFAPGEDFGLGSHTIIWDGNDQDGNPVPPGEYYYYLYGYDNVNYRIKVFQSSKWMTDSWSDIKYADHQIVEYDYEGSTLPKPIIYFDSGIGRRSGPDDLYGGAVHDDLFGFNPDDGSNSRGRWHIGDEPFDDTLVESTHYTGIGKEHNIVMDPYEAEHFITMAGDPELVTHIRRFEWVTGGESIQDMDWGDSGAYTFASKGVDGWDATISGMEYAGDDILAVTNATHYGVSSESELILIDATDGTEMRRLDVSEWWINPDDKIRGGQESGGPNQMSVRDGRIAIAAHGACMYQVIKPSAGELKEDWMIWTNGNGDYVADRNYEDDSGKPWVCIDYAAKPNTYMIKQDANYFTTVTLYGLGVDSFALFAPDGTGIGHFAFNHDGSGPHHQNEFVDTGGAYDGNYLDNVGLNFRNDPLNETSEGIWYLAQDSIKGVIGPFTGVNEAVPATFSLAQNTPNPFNPSTTIQFTLPSPGFVTLDIFNITGQKVHTLLSDTVSAGTHSHMWDGCDIQGRRLSAGVYISSLTSGGKTATKTMTMIK